MATAASASGRSTRSTGTAISAAAASTAGPRVEQVQSTSLAPCHQLLQGLRGLCGDVRGYLADQLGAQQQVLADQVAQHGLGQDLLEELGKGADVHLAGVQQGEVRHALSSAGREPGRGRCRSAGCR